MVRAAPLLLLLALALHAHTLCYNPSTVATLNIPQYMGVWFQQAESRFIQDTIERNTTCVQVTYMLNENGTVAVHNQGRIGSPSGPIDNIYGFAEIPDASFPGRLKVYLEGSYIPKVGAPYWIVQLGPAVNNQYSWAIVSDNLCLSLFILTRDQVASQQDIATMQTYVASIGFNLNDWIPMVQQGCVYNNTITN